MTDRLTETIERLQEASTRASGYPVDSTLMISHPNVKGIVVTSLTIPDLLFAAQELRRLREQGASPLMALCVLQGWVQQLSFMQQTVLLTAIRGPDGLPKYGPTKLLLRWFRRCVLLSAMDGKVLDTPWDNNGGSFTGPSLSIETVRNRLYCADRDCLDIGEKTDEVCVAHLELQWERLMDEIAGQYLRDLDAIPHHFQLHFLHAAEIVGYKHPDARIRAWWAKLYVRLVEDMHLHPETEAEMDRRLGDSREQWLERADPATRA